MLKYTHVSQKANITCPEPVEGNRQQLAPFPFGAPVIAENRTNRPAPIELSSRLFGAGHPKKHSMAIKPSKTRL